jgi:hypothetical protein
MKNQDFPIKKTFSVDFMYEGKKVFTFTFEQATIMEYYEFFALSTEARVQFMYDMIYKQCPKSFIEKITKRVPRYMSGMKLEQVMKMIIENRFRTYTSIYEGENTKKGGKSLLASNMSYVCQKYVIDPLTLFERYTWEQYLWMMDGVIWQGNEMSKEGQIRNKSAIIDKEAVKKRAEETKKAFSQLNNQ